MNKQICNTCFKEFSSIKSLDFHKSICIYYQYRNKYSSNISNDKIQDIIVLFNGIDMSKNTKNILKNKILTNIKLKYTLKSNNILMYLYDKILDNQLEYYCFADVLNIISSITNVQFNDIIDIINTFDKCTNNLF
jgi:hypothetical protein